MSYIYDGTNSTTGWREISEWWAYDGTNSVTGWRDIQEAWAYDGSTWRLVHQAVSCATASIDLASSAWTVANCTDANECQICIKVNHTDCTDECHNIDGKVSVNGGSFVLQLTCRDKSCTFQGATDCAGEFDCNTQSGGSRCFSNSNTHKPRVEIQRDSDSGVDATWTYGSTYTGVCFAV